MNPALVQRLRQADLVARTGRVRRILPTFVEADGPAVGLGALCTIETRANDTETEDAVAEVVGVKDETIVLAPLQSAGPIHPGARVTACGDSGQVAVGDAFLGRAIDALGRPIDGGPAIRPRAFAPLAGTETPPLERGTPSDPLETGVRAIDSVLTLARGQRVGIFAASGVGKTTLMSQLARQVSADRCVVCLVGERGREVEDLWRRTLSDEARARTVLVAATSDQTAAMRNRAGAYALALAEHWRSEGHHVLLLLDSVTRLAMAMRETGLAAGEPPTVRAYTPGVFAAIPRLVERCGALASGGAITGIMTVLSETDDNDDPICELMKSILDGHIVLSRTLAEQAHFPALDIPRSISRLARGLQDAAATAAAQAAVALLSTYETSRTLIETGVYTPGSNAEIDRAIALRPRLLAFFRQGSEERTTPSEARAALAQLTLGAA